MIKKLVKNASLYLLGSILTNAISFLFIPVITNAISVDDFGRLSLVLLIGNFVSPLINFGTGGAVTKQFYQLSKSEARSYVYNAGLVSGFLFLLVLAVFLICGNFIAEYFEIAYRFILIIPFIAFGGVMQQFLLAVLRILKKPVAFSLISILGGILNFLLGFLFVIVLDAGWEGRLISLLILNITLAVTAISFLVAKKHMNFRYQKKYLKEVFHFGLPIFIHLLSTVAITFTDHLLISLLLNNTNLGIYSLAARLVFPISVLRVSILNAIDPERYKLLTEGSYESKVKLIKVLTIYFGAIALMVFVSCLVYKLIFPYVFSEDYQTAFRIIIPLSMIVVVEAFYNVFTAQLYFIGKTRVYMFASFFNVGINVILNYFLILKYGIVGAAIATLISKLLFTFIIAYVSSKAYKLPWKALLHAWKKNHN